MTKYVFSIIIFTMLVGCGTVQYVVSRNVPYKPSVTVIPLYSKHSDLKYAGAIEKLLINMGISVIAPPARIRSTETLDQQKAAGEAEISNNSGTSSAQGKAGTQSLKIKKEYKGLDQTTATHILITDSRNSIIKIIKNDSNEVLAVLDGIRGVRRSERQLRKVFKVLGFNIRENK